MGFRRETETANPAPEASSEKQQQQQKVQHSNHVLDPALKQALIDNNRETGALERYDVNYLQHTWLLQEAHSGSSTTLLFCLVWLLNSAKAGGDCAGVLWGCQQHQPGVPAVHIKL